MEFNQNPLIFLMLLPLFLAPARPASGEPPPDDLDALVTVYKEYGLPPPPSDPPLVQFACGYHTLAGGKEEPIFHLGVLPKSAAANQPPTLLVGTENFLDDPTVPDEASDPKRFDGPYAGFTLPRFAVRDLAAMKISPILRSSAALQLPKIGLPTSRPPCGRGRKKRRIANCNVRRCGRRNRR